MRSLATGIFFPPSIPSIERTNKSLRALQLEIGTYSHFVGSLHLYDEDEGKARSYFDEGFQSPVAMPAMPKGDPWRSVTWLLEAGHAIRCDRPEPQKAGINDYWIDLARLLRIKKLYDTKDLRRLIQIKNEMATHVDFRA
jgi:thymidylate synthase